MPNKEKMINIKIEEETKKKLMELAEKDSRTLSSYIRMIFNKVVSGEIKP